MNDPIRELLEKWRHEVEVLERFIGKKLGRDTYPCGHHERLKIVIADLEQALQKCESVRLNATKEPKE